jgi:hypothetical protein
VFANRDKVAFGIKMSATMWDLLARTNQMGLSLKMTTVDMKCRANLDSFWSRAKSTVLANCDKVAFGIKMSATMGLLGPYESDGSLPEDDHCGYEVAFKMLLHSRRPGSYSESYMQFETVRKLRSTFSNHCRASAKANQISMALGDQKGGYLQFATDPCSLFWFYRLIKGA